MVPLASQTNLNEVDNNDTPSSNSIPMENYGTTEDHEQTSLISGVTTSSNHTDNETHAATTVASSMISIASSTSLYFQHHQQLQPQKHHSHRSSDSLEYSTTSSTNSIPPPIHTQHEQASARSYLGSIVRSLGHQQAFPSSMFPGQKLISPINSRETIDVQDGFFENSNATPSPSSSRTYPSYYYFPKRRDSISSSGTSSSSPHRSLPLSYQNAGVSKNVYQKRRKPGFCPDEDFAVNEIEDGSRLASWRKCWRCFFSPRVLVTLVVCGVIVFNLVRLGSQQHLQHVQANSKITNSSIRGKGTSGAGSRNTVSSSKSVSDIDADYVKLEVIGGGKSNSFRSGSSDFSLFSDTDHP